MYMKNKYQEELCKIEMSEELKHTIKEHVHASKPHKQKRYISLTLGTLALVCTFVIAFTLIQKTNIKEAPSIVSNFIDKGAQENKNTFDKKTGTADSIMNDKSIDSKRISGIMKGAVYYPKTYNYVYGGLGASDNNNESANDLAMYIQKKTYTNVTGKLPIYEETHPKKDIRYQHPLSEKERNEIAVNYSKKLNMKNISIAYGIASLRNEPETMQEGNYMVNTIHVNENGNVTISIKTKGNGKEDTKEQLEAASKKLFKKFKNIIPIQHPLWNTTSKHHPYLKKTIYATQLYEKGSDKEELKNQATSSVRITSENYGEIKSYEMTLFSSENLKKIEEVVIMNENEAQQVLLAGGYFSDFPTDKTSLQVENIKHVDLLYRDVNAVNTDTFSPYVIPFYRFYMQNGKDSDIRIYDVPAIYPDDLKELNKNDWYFKS